MGKYAVKDNSLKCTVDFIISYTNKYVVMCIIRNKPFPVSYAMYHSLELTAPLSQRVEVNGVLVSWGWLVCSLFSHQLSRNSFRG